MTEYLSVETIISINNRFRGGAIDHAGIESAAYRPQSGAGDQDAFPTIWLKAAVYVHAFATTQYFADGNKRTAWVAANMFLDRNGHEMPPIDEIEGETFVRAVAQKVFDTEDEPDATVKKAAEWFRSKWVNQRRGPALDPRLEFVFISRGFEQFDGSWDATASGISSIEVTEGFPIPLPLCVVGLFHWDVIDTIRDDHTMEAEFVADEGFRRPKRAKRIIDAGHATVPSAHPHHHTGHLPVMFCLVISPVFAEPCTGRIELRLDGDLIATIPFRVYEPLQVPDSAFEFPPDLMPSQ